MFRSIINWLRDRLGSVLPSVDHEQFSKDSRESTSPVPARYTPVIQDSHIAQAEAKEIEPQFVSAQAPALAQTPGPAWAWAWPPAKALDIAPTDMQRAVEARRCLERIELELNTTLSQVKTPRAENIVATYRNEFMYLGSVLEKAIDYKINGRGNLSKKERQRLLIAVQERHALLFSSPGMLIPQLKLNQPNREQLKQASYAIEGRLHAVREAIYDFLQNDSVKLKTNQYRPISFWKQV